MRMDFKVLKWQILRGSLAKRLFIRALLFTLAMVIISFAQMSNDIRKGKLVLSESGDCGLDVVSDSDVSVTGFWKPVSATMFGFLGGSMRKRESKDLSRSVFKDLMGKKMLDTHAKALCVGEGADLTALLLQEMGLSDAFGVRSHPFFSLWKKRFVYELSFEDNYFDFVFSRDLDRVSVPALLVLEIERVLRPGGIGAMLIGMSTFYSGSSARSATPVSSFLKSSNMISICGIGSFTLVTFRKKFDNVALFEHYRLPDKCPSITNNKPFMKYIEPLAVNQLGHLESDISYLSKFMNISSRKRVVYINLGAGELVNTSITEILEPNYHFPLQALDMYLLDHDASALSLYVQKAGITFVYHPDLVGYTVPQLDLDEELSAPHEVDEFEFIRWFKETIREGDFVILMMTARAAELKIIFELFESGTICHVDELFLQCSDTAHCKDSVCGDCRSLFRGLRNGGVFSHQWWEPETLF